jgi:hypothetical protein
MATKWHTIQVEYQNNRKPSWKRLLERMGRTIQLIDISERRGGGVITFEAHTRQSAYRNSKLIRRCRGVRGVQIVTETF